MGLLLLQGQKSLVEVGLVGIVGMEVVRNDGVSMSFHRERINGRGIEFDEYCFTTLASFLFLFFGYRAFGFFLGIWGFCYLSCLGYISFCCLFSLLCVYLHCR